MTHVALIRGINVGGKNAVPMAGLRAALEAKGFTSVATYIQSGNVVFDVPARSGSGPATDEIAQAVEGVLALEFGVTTVVVALDADAYLAAVASAPPGFGEDDETHKHDVVFLRPSLDSASLVSQVRLRESVDAAWAGPGCLYFRRVSALVTKSYLRDIMTMPEYKDMTIRNWRTTLAIAALLGARSEGASGQ